MGRRHCRDRFRSEIEEIPKTVRRNVLNNSFRTLHDLVNSLCSHSCKSNNKQDEPYFPRALIMFFSRVWWIFCFYCKDSKLHFKFSFFIFQTGIPHQIRSHRAMVIAKMGKRNEPQTAARNTETTFWWETARSGEETLSGEKSSYAEHHKYKG